MKKQNTSNINTPAANQASTSPSHSIEQTLAKGKATAILNLGLRSHYNKSIGKNNKSP